VGLAAGVVLGLVLVDVGGELRLAGARWGVSGGRPGIVPWCSRRAGEPRKRSGGDPPSAQGCRPLRLQGVGPIHRSGAWQAYDGNRARACGPSLLLGPAAVGLASPAGGGVLHGHCGGSSSVGVSTTVSEGVATLGEPASGLRVSARTRVTAVIGRTALRAPGPAPPEQGESCPPAAVGCRCPNRMPPPAGASCPPSPWSWPMVRARAGCRSVGRGDDGPMRRCVQLLKKSEGEQGGF
jgi:hypothetical protein